VIVYSHTPRSWLLQGHHDDNDDNDDVGDDENGHDEEDGNHDRGSNRLLFGGR